MQFDPQVGGCLCSAVRYRLNTDPVTLYACHCTDCQAGSGSAFGLSLLIQEDSLEFTGASPARFECRLDSERRKRTFYCSDCHTEVCGISSVAGIRNLRPGTLDDTSWLEPVGHIWTRSAQRWVSLAEGTLQYPEQPDDILDLVRAWKSR
jgi:hypothetical protein